MTWLTGWNYQKLLYINGTSAGNQSNYQMKVIINYGSGTDWTPTNNIYCNSQCKIDFSDIRFTDTIGNILYYWIDPVNTINGSYATVWIKIPNIPTGSNSTYIYFYYGNSSAANLSNGRNTFIVFDDFSTGSTEQWTKVDPDNVITIDRTTNHQIYFNNIWGKKDNRVYFNSALSVANFRYDFTSNMISGNFITNYLVGFETVNSQLYPWHDNGIYFESYKPDSSSSDRLYLVTISGNQNNTLPYTGSVNNTYYFSLIRIGSTAYLYIYSNISRTNLIASGSLACSTANMIYVYALQTVGGGGGENQVTGFVKDIIIRNYTSTEPTWSSQQPVTLNISSSPSGGEIWLASPTGTSWVDQIIQTPKTIYVPAGTSYDVEVGLGGYYPWSVVNICTGNCAAGSVWNIIATLTPQPGSLSISSTPEGAEIYLALSPSTPVDQGTTTITGGRTISNLSPGLYNLRLTLSGYQNWTGTANITSNNTSTINATFAGSANITSTPSGAEIYLAISPGTPSDQSVTTPKIITGLTAASSGATTIWNYRFTLSGYADNSGSFTAYAGQTVNVPITFPGSLYITSLPVGAQIYIDGYLQ